jgi:hypothetical protein
LRSNKVKTGQTLAGQRRAVRGATAGNFPVVAEKSGGLSSAELAVKTRAIPGLGHSNKGKVKKGRHARFPESQQPFAFAAA